MYNICLKKNRSTTSSNITFAKGYNKVHSIIRGNRKCEDPIDYWKWYDGDIDQTISIRCS